MTSTTDTPDTPTLVVNETVAQAQLDAGAQGITCQKIGEAEIMADAGMTDIPITYNILGPAKLARLRGLSERLARLSVVADNATVIDGLSAAFADAKHPLPVLAECDTGARRCGVQSPAEALALTQRLVDADGISFDGVMTYPSNGGAADAAAFIGCFCIKVRNATRPVRLEAT